MSTEERTAIDDFERLARAIVERPLWTLRHAGYEPVVEREVESQFTVGNGLLGVRGSLELPTLASRPRTFVAGLFDVTHDSSEWTFLAPAPDWLHLAIAVNGQEIEFNGEDPSHVRTLDMRSGLLLADWNHRMASGEGLRISTFRLASLAQRTSPSRWPGSPPRSPPR